MKAGGQNIRQHGQVANFLDGLFAVREFQQIEVGIRHHDIACLPADPPAHIDIAICSASARWIDGEANTCVL
ncbi:hypothetical protein D9M72_551760 [compost metagenome]